MTSGATDILSKPPNWFMRWGMTVLLGWILILLLLAWLIRYPDTLEAPTVCVTTAPIQEVRARMAGNLELLIPNSDPAVIAGQQIALISPDLQVENLRAIKVWIAKTQEDPFGTPLLEVKDLGPLTPALAEYQKTWKTLRREEARSDYAQQLAILEKQIQELESRKNQFAKTAQLQEHAVQLKAAQFERSKQLFGSGAIGEIELEESEEAYLVALQERARIRQDSIVLKEQMLGVQHQIIVVEAQREEKFSLLRMELSQLATQLEGAIDAWEYQHVLEAPFAGDLEFAQSWTTGQWIEAGERFALLKGGNEEEVRPTFEVFLPANNAGNVQMGAPVNIRLTEYPHPEYGVLRGLVSYKAEVPIEGRYRILVSLIELKDEVASTSYQKNIHLNPGLSGRASIRMDHKRLLERIFEQLLAAIRQE